LKLLAEVEGAMFSTYIRPKTSDDFWKDFISGREVGLERAIVGMRLRFQVLADEVAKAITSVPEHSPREHRERMPPR